MTDQLKIDIICALARATASAAKGDTRGVISGVQCVLGCLGLETLSVEDNPSTLVKP